MQFNDIKQLERNFKDHSYSFFINTKIKSAHKLYTKPLGIFVDTKDRTAQDIQSRLVQEIEKEDCRSFVVLGDSGSGKTSLALYLCNEYWKKLSVNSNEVNENSYVPIYLSLRQIELHIDCKEILSTFCEISPGNIKVANLLNFNLLLFLDGYDELDKKINLWEHNNWWLPERRKKVKTVTFCKSIGLTVLERDRCFTFGYEEKSKFISIQPFGCGQIDDYLRKTVTLLRNFPICDENFENDPWLMTKKVTGKFDVWENDTKEYEKWLSTTFPDLKKIAGNPYLLTIILQILPGIVENIKKSSMKSANGLSVNEQERAIRIRCSTEVGIYDEFVSQWFRYQATKSRRTKSNPDFMKIPLDHIAGFMLAYAQNLAFTLVQKNGGFSGDGSISEEESNLWHLWKPNQNKGLLDLVDAESADGDPNYLKLFPKDQRENDVDRLCNFKSLRNACLLSNPTASTLKFFHSSLVEYLAAREVFENIRGQFNFYLNADDPIYIKHKDNKEIVFGINVTDINDYYPLLNNLAERTQTDDSFKHLLFEIIDKSKEIFILSRMSANAMTILNFAGICMSGRNFQNVRLTGAYLSGSNFANSNFQFADLSRVNLQNCWMVGCDFQGANFDKVNFGQNLSVDLGRGAVGGIVGDGKNNLLISYLDQKVHSYNFDNGKLRDIKSEKGSGKQFLYVESNVLLIHKCSRKQLQSPLYTYTILPTSLTVDVWNLNSNEKMDSIIVDHPIGQWPRLTTHAEESIFVVAGKEVEKELFLNRTRDEGIIYYYEIHSCQKGNVGLVLLWGYVVKDESIIEYREPQILNTFQIATKEAHRTLFTLYSDFLIRCFDIYDNKLVAMKGVDFVAISSILTKNLIFKDNFAINNPDYVPEVIKFSSNGRYLIYRSDFIYICFIDDVKVESTMKLIEVAYDETSFFVVFNKSCDMTAFSHDENIFICKLPDGAIIKKIYRRYGLRYIAFPPFTFTDQTTENSKLFCYTADSVLETIEITEANQPISHRRIKELRNFYVSNDNRLVATYYTIFGEHRRDILRVFTTPITSQSMLFRKEIQAEINKLLFTENYLLVIVNEGTEVFVMDMNGNTYQSIQFPAEEIRLKFISSKYQRIVFDRAQGLNSSELQLCKIVELRTDDCRMAPVAFENLGCLSTNIDVCEINFDCKDGSHILLQERDKVENNFQNVWLWMPAENVYLQMQISSTLSLQDLGLSFYMLDDKCERYNGDGNFFIEFSSANFAKPLKKQFCSFSDESTRLNKFYLNVNWRASLQYNQTFYIHCLKNDNCLAEIPLQHHVHDFNLHFEYNSHGDILERVEILTWVCFGSMSMSSFSIADINRRIADDPPTPAMLPKWKLNWTVESNSILNLQNSKIAKTFKVSERNKLLLKTFNRNSDIGEPWPEDDKYFSLSELYMPITEMETKYAIINTEDSSRPRMLISADDWVVSAVAKNSKSNTCNTVHIEHVGLLIEGINNGRHFAMEADLYNSEGYVRIKLRPVTAMKRLHKLQTDYIVNQWMKPKSDVQTLIRSIQNDQIIDGRKYKFLRNNCASWCIQKLKEIGIKKYRKKWYRKIVLVDLPSDLFRIKDKIVKNRLPFNPFKNS